LHEQEIEELKANNDAHTTKGELEVSILIILILKHALKSFMYVGIGSENQPVDVGERKFQTETG